MSVNDTLVIAAKVEVKISYQHRRYSDARARELLSKKKKNSESSNSYSAYDLKRALLVLFLMKLPPSRSCQVSPIHIVVLKIVAIP